MNATIVVHEAVELGELLLVAADSNDVPGAEELGDLHGDAAGYARRACDGDALTLLQLAAHLDRHPGGEAGDAAGERLAGVGALGKREALLGIEDDPLGHGAVLEIAGATEVDELAVGGACDAFHARRVRRLGADRVELAARDGAVDGVQPAAMTVPSGASPSGSGRSTIAGVWP